jgi:radical SAM superfamily enzyme YgiQ (UPF0313 family)
MYRSVAFRVRPVDEVLRQINRAQAYIGYIRRVFLADGDALVLDTGKLLDILAALREKLPRIQRISCYAGPQDILRKTPAELAALREAGLRLVYYGMESGDDEVLARACKGVNGAESVAAGQKIVAAGMKLSMMVILGLAGKPGSIRHADHTARAVNAIRPNMLSALTLMLYRGSELLAEYEKGQFELLSPAEIMDELDRLIGNIDLPAGSHCLFRSNHISNYAALAGTLPQDKDRLLREIRQARQKLAGLPDWDRYNNAEI